MTAPKMATAVEDDLTLLFNLFTEIGIIQQLSSNAIRPLLPDGISMAQFGVLNHFVRRGGSETPAQLALAFQVTKGAMTNTLQRLAAKDFVSITPDPEDARRKLVSITKAGVKAHARTGKNLSPHFAQLAQDLDLASLGKALPALQQLRAYLDQARDQTG